MICHLCHRLNVLLMGKIIDGKAMILILIWMISRGNAKEIYVHREPPKITNLNGPCSTILHIEDSSTLEELLGIVSERLQFPASEFRLEGKILEQSDFVSLEERTVIGVFEEQLNINHKVDM